MRTSRGLAILALTAIGLTLPILLLGAPRSDSAVFNFVWTKQFADAIARGELYPRWLPGSFDGLGSPVFYYYAPLAFYVTSAFDLAGMPLLHAIGAAEAFLLFASGATMYLWLRDKTQRPVLWACAFMAAPYHLIDVYVRSALAELSSFIWLPLLALAIENIRKRWGPPLLALAYAGLAFSHLPMTVLATAFLIGPMVAHRTASERGPAAPLRCLMGVAAGVGLAAVYLAPALILLPHLNADVLWQAQFRPASWSLFWPDGVPRPLLYTMAAIAISGMLVAGAAHAGFWSALAIGIAIASLGLPPLLWDLPILKQVQFPWRSLALLEFVVITAVAVGRPKRIYVFVAALLATPSLISFGQAAFSGFLKPYQPDLERSLPDAVEYLPKGLPRPAYGAYSPPASVLPPTPVSGPVRNLRLSDDGSVSFEAVTSGTVVVRRANFPGWIAQRDNEAITPGPGPLLNFKIRPGVYQVRREALPAERLGGLISLASSVGLAAAIAYLLWRRADAPRGKRRELKGRAEVAASQQRS